MLLNESAYLEGFLLFINFFTEPLKRDSKYLVQPNSFDAFAID